VWTALAKEGARDPRAGSLEAFRSEKNRKKLGLVSKHFLLVSTIEQRRE
jgi:hypothetical protein